jgi:glycosyltransferase involved in cell wall biosynthesis
VSIKVLHVVAGDLSEGAARGAYWLHRGLLQAGIKSRMLVQHTDGTDPTVKQVYDNRFHDLSVLSRIALDRLPTLVYLNREKSIFSTGISGVDVRKLDDCQWADIIHLHWINNGMINVKLLKEIGKPIVWTMRDMWPMTGGCHYSNECKGYENRCGHCPKLNSNSGYDLSRYVLNRKKQYYTRNMTFVAISRWLKECAKNSYLLSEYDIKVIPNAVDTKDFFPIKKNTARKKLGLPHDKKIILLGATSIHDKYKGFDKFQSSINYLGGNYLFVFFGNINNEVLDLLDIEYKSLGFLRDNRTLRFAYSAADVFVAPSIQEAFGKTLVEAMACGTPVVAFDATGPRDIVEHKVTGYLAQPFVAEDLARGIEWVLEDNDQRLNLIEQSIKKVEECFKIEIVAQHYTGLYTDILKEKHHV